MDTTLLKQVVSPAHVSQVCEYGFSGLPGGMWILKPLKRLEPSYRLPVTRLKPGENENALQTDPLAYFCFSIPNMRCDKLGRKRCC
jgi:hypothetical protein